ncbi:hypothetical protein QAD02_019347 [Eretmocerus hayati]|uniref:Uncharacterized protein n=1 Tax=Eretmocerus hayati TaxID=131215 RepID=A0ACC2PJF7_9HYME|nr:hypothetical protein QAD02_019347 [Eretmocerus hayati]
MRILMSVVVLVTGSLLVALTSSANMETAFKWRYIDYNWPSKAERSEAIRTGAYNTSAPLPMDVDVSHDGRVFLSMEGGPGVPARLGYVTKNKSSAGPLLQPYPDWSWHQGNDCDTTIKEVLRVSIDKCNRLWVLDTGSRNASKRLCQPKVLVFDLNNDSLISRIILPDEIIQEARTNLSLPATIIVETHGYVCHDTTEIVAQDSERLQYADGIKVIRRPAVPEEELWVLSNRHTLYRSNQMDFKDFNFYVLRSPVRSLIAGTKCELPKEISDALIPSY